VKVADNVPAVRLSPKARKRVWRSRGGARTTTWKLQLALWPRASVAWQVTALDPTANGPGCAVQVTFTGATPPVVCAGLNVTFTGVPSVDSASTFAGHDTVSAGTGGGGGAVGDEPPQPAASASTAANAVSVRNPPATRGIE
jgi:hypothetical protein